MRIIQPSVELIFPTREVLAIFNPEALIERAGRTCYKSDIVKCKACGGTGKVSLDASVVQPESTCLLCDGKGYSDRDYAGNPDPESAAKFVGRIMKRGHEAVIEHASATLKFVTCRGVTHEKVRHRLGAYCQECVAGTTKIRNNKTIKELFDRSQSPSGITHNRMLQLHSCNDNNEIVPNKIVRVFHKGKAKLFRVRTSSGYEICATKNHEFMVPGGSFTRLRDLAIGSAVMINGRPSLLKICDADLKDAYLNEELSPQEIADRYAVPYRSVLSRLQKLGIFERRLNDKDKEKYNRNHTHASYVKMRKTLQKQYDNGRKPWNKGVREHENESVRRQGKSLRKHHHNNRFEEENSNWQGGVSQGYYARIVGKGRCELCGTPNADEIHHIDQNRRNNKRENLLRVCNNCHKKLHKGWHVGKVAHSDTIVSITYEGIDDVYDLEMEAPLHNYVADGFVVHNSTRYCDYDKDKFGNEIAVIVPPYHLLPGQESAYADWAEGMREDEERYQRQRARGVPPEIAREGLPNALKTEIVSTYNFREWRHFFRLRMSKFAHPQIRQVAVMAWSLLSSYVAPTCFNTDEFNELGEAILRDPMIPGAPVETARGEHMEWRYE